MVNRSVVYHHQAVGSQWTHGFWFNHLQSFRKSQECSENVNFDFEPKKRRLKEATHRARSILVNLDLTHVGLHWACSWVMLTYVNFCWLKDDLWMNYMSFVMLYDGVWCRMMLYADVRMAPMRMPFLLLDVMMCEVGLLFHFVSRKRQSLLNYPSLRLFEKLVLLIYTFIFDARINFKRMNLIWLKASQNLSVQIFLRFFSQILVPLMTKKKVSCSEHVRGSMNPGNPGSWTRKRGAVPIVPRRWGKIHLQRFKMDVGNGRVMYCQLKVRLFVFSWVCSFIVSEFVFLHFSIVEQCWINTLNIGLSPLPGCQSPPGLWNIFRIGDPKLNLHLPLESWEGGQPKLTMVFLNPWGYTPWALVTVDAEDSVGFRTKSFSPQMRRTEEFEFERQEFGHILLGVWDEILKSNDFEFFLLYSTQF